MKRWLLPLLVWVVLVASVSQSLPTHVFAATYEAEVDYVVDGDTVSLKQPVLGTTKVRLLAIDAPETNYYGQNQGHHAFDAKTYLQQLLPPGTPITLVTDTQEKDSYGRLLAHLFKGSRNVNKEMLLQGHAVTYYIWPNMMYFEDYRNALLQAKQTGRGIWNPSDPLTELPFEFRLRVSGRQPDKYVGDYFTKEYVDPANYNDIAVENRVFFLTEQDAIYAGYRKKGSQVVTSGLYINELLPAPKTNYTTEWIEIYNSTDQAIDLGGYKIDDLRNGGQAAYTIPAGTIIPPKGFFVWDTNSYFNNDGDEAYLIAPDGTVVDSFSYSSTQYDASFYRYPNGGSWASGMDIAPTKSASNQ